MNYILCEYTNKNEYDAGNKARSDVTVIADRLGYVHIPLFRSGANKAIICGQLIKGVLKAILLAKKNEDILMQYPYYPSLVNKILFGMLNIGKRIKHYKLSIVIHDVAALRNINYNKENGRNILAEELKLLTVFDRVVCHNDKMAREFNEAGFKNNLIILGPFDYLYDKPSIQIFTEERKKEIVVAGNLKEEKSGYIYKLPVLKEVKFNLYGVGYIGENNEYISYKGKFPPEELIQHLSGHFGLVWDGNSVNTCDGMFGQYLKYNNPHKLSLYIAAGLPLIIWSRAALAEYVLAKNIGITIDSLEELDKRIKAITNEEYNIMLQNIAKVRKNIISGEHLKKALINNNSSI